MLRALADEHVHGAIVAGLRRRGMDVDTVQERHLTGTHDEALLEIAASEHRLLLTYDTDLLTIRAAWTSEARTHAGIVFWMGNQLPIGEAIRRLIDYATHTQPDEARGVVKYL